MGLNKEVSNKKKTSDPPTKDPEVKTHSEENKTMSINLGLKTKKRDPPISENKKVADEFDEQEENRRKIEQIKGSISSSNGNSKKQKKKKKSKNNIRQNPEDFDSSSSDDESNSVSSSSDSEADEPRGKKNKKDEVVIKTEPVTKSSKNVVHHHHHPPAQKKPISATSEEKNDNDIKYLETVNDCSDVVRDISLQNLYVEHDKIDDKGKDAKEIEFFEMRRRIRILPVRVRKDKGIYIRDEGGEEVQFFTWVDFLTAIGKPNFKGTPNNPEPKGFLRAKFHGTAKKILPIEWLSKTENTQKFISESNEFHTDLVSLIQTPKPELIEKGLLKDKPSSPLRVPPNSRSGTSKKKKGSSTPKGEKKRKIDKDDYSDEMDIQIPDEYYRDREEKAWASFFTGSIAIRKYLDEESQKKLRPFIKLSVQTLMDQEI